jgi:hypothetical protein
MTVSRVQMSEFNNKIAPSAPMVPPSIQRKMEYGFIKPPDVSKAQLT